MGKPLSIELRNRVAAYVDEGHGLREPARHFWVCRVLRVSRLSGGEKRGRFSRGAKALARLVIIDGTSTNTILCKRTGWAPKGERYLTHAPLRQWRTQTSIAGLRSHGPIAPWIVEGALDGEIFEQHGETQLTPERPSNTDQLSLIGRKSARILQHKTGAPFLGSLTP